MCLLKNTEAGLLLQQQMSQLHVMSAGHFSKELRLLLLKLLCFKPFCQSTRHTVY